MKQLEEETDDKNIQKLLDQLPYFVISREKGSQFRALLNLIRETGFGMRNQDTHFFATSLRSLGIPTTRKEIVVKGAKPQTYYVLLSRHKDRAIKALKEDQSLQRFQRKSNG